MKKQKKQNIFGRIALAVLGGVDVVFRILTPIAVALLLIIVFPAINQPLIMGLGLLATLYRAIEMWRY